MSLAIHLPILIILIALSGFFSGVEVALVSIGRLKLRTLVEKNKRGAHSLKKLKEDSSRMLTTILVGNNIVNIAASALATYLATEHFGYMGVGIATGVMTFLILVFGEITPKTYAENNNIKIALAVAPLIILLQKILLPVILFFEFFLKIAEKFYSKKGKQKLTEEEFKTIVEVGYEDKVLDKKDKEIIEGVIRFDDIKVKQIMTPKVRMFSLKENLTVELAIKRVNKTRFSRFPVFDKHEKDVVGLVHTKDLMRAFEKDPYQKIKKIMRKPYFTSKEAVINQLLKVMQHQNQHLAMVLNEYGEVEGVITLENILEEIVGEIFDETDKLRHDVRFIDENTFLALGDTEISKLEKKLGTIFENDSDAITLSGLLHYHMKKIPEVESEIEIQGYHFKVKEVKDNKPTWILITRK